VSTTDSFTLLDFAPDGAELRRSEPGDPELWAVWLDGDIIGSGECPSEAVEAALAQIRIWESESDT
jgi:hypothetical protein